MRAKAPEIPATAALLWSLLDEPLIRWRSTDGGTLQSASLPQLLAAMAANEVRDWYSRLKSRPAFRTLLNDRVGGMPAHAGYKDLDF